MKKKSLVVLLSVFFSCNNVTNDSLQVENTSIVQATESVRIAKDSVELPVEVRKEYLKKGYQLLQNHINDSTYLKHLSQISIAGYRLKDSLFYRNVYEELSSLALENSDYMVLGEAHWDMASFQKSYLVIDSAYYYYQLAYQNFDKLPSSQSTDYLKARMLYSMALAQDDLKDYLGAESNTTKAIKTFAEQKDNYWLSASYNLLSSIQSGFKNENKTREYLKKAGGYLESLNNENLVWINKNNLANSYLREEDYESAIQTYKPLLQNNEFRQQDPELYSKALVGHTYARFKLGETDEELNQEYLRAISTFIEIDEPQDLGWARQKLAELLLAQGKKDEAVKLAKEVKQFAEETQNNDRRLEVLKFLTEIDSENAVAYSTAYYDLAEQLKEEERATRDKFARVRLETDQIIEENEVLSRQKQIWIGVTLGLILLGIALMTIISQRISNNRLKFQQKQQESNQEIYNLMLAQQGKFEEGKKLEQKRISEELHDGILGQMLGIRLVLTGLNEMVDEKSVEQRAELIEKLRDTEEEIRTISHELNNASYQKIHNFIVSLEDMIDSIGASSGIACSFTYDPLLEWDSLEGDIKINAYRIVQESLQNCVKHARCKSAHVNFECKKENLRLSIKDDGVGFDINKGKRGIGLRNIISRVKKVNGTLDIESKKGKGTTIKVSIPLNYTQKTDFLEDLELKQTIKA